MDYEGKSPSSYYLNIIQVLIPSMTYSQLVHFVNYTPLLLLQEIETMFMIEYIQMFIQKPKIIILMIIFCT